MKLPLKMYQQLILRVRFKKFGQKIGKRAILEKSHCKIKSGDTLNFVESGGKSLMSVIKFKPTSAGKRGTVKVKPDNLWKGRPLRKLVESKKTINGRNSLGHITTRHRGGGHKRLYRLIDFKRNKDSIHHIVSRMSTIQIEAV